MDPMWLFSTYLANVVGHFITKLPFATTLIGMNVYTGLFVSLLAMMGYLFCTRKLHISAGITFLGELVAVSLCWCPTALLYNYLTYVLFLTCVILLYEGLTKKKTWMLFAAGICLGTNVFVRFSNLPEAALIVAVWGYGVLEALEEKNAKIAWKRTLSRTLWCMGGYAAALVVFLGGIQIRYGLSTYIEGIRSLFAMTDTATDYKAISMLMGVVNTYREYLYWLVRFGLITLLGVVFFLAHYFISGRRAKIINKEHVLSNLTKPLLIAWAGLCVASFIFVWYSAFYLVLFQSLRGMLKWMILFLTVTLFLTVIFDRAEVMYIGWVTVCGYMVWWLYDIGFCSFLFYSYDSMLRPGIVFMMLTMLIALIHIFQKNRDKADKLLVGMLILIILLTSIGSNNGVYPSLNNLFIAIPYTFGEVWKFGRKAQDSGGVPTFPAKGVLVAFLGLFCFQSVLFGGRFTFAEATGVQDISAHVENNPVLKGVHMSVEKAEWMSSLSAYVAEQDLVGKEVILYGDIPALSFYLQMPYAFSPWSDLRSYSIGSLQKELERIQTGNTGTRPVVILENTFATYFEGGETALTEIEISEDKYRALLNDEKFVLLCNYLKEAGYQSTFRNEKFAIYE